MIEIDYDRVLSIECAVVLDHEPVEQGIDVNVYCHERSYVTVFEYDHDSVMLMKMVCFDHAAELIMDEACEYCEAKWKNHYPKGMVTRHHSNGCPHLESLASAMHGPRPDLILRDDIDERDEPHPAQGPVKPVNTGNVKKN